MKKIIHHIRKQPDYIKRQIFNILMIVFAVILFLLWIYSLGTTLTSTDTQEQISEDIKPFSALKDNMMDGYNNIVEPDLGAQE